MITDESGYTSGFETYPSPQSNVPSGSLAPCPFCGVELYACTYDGGKTRHAHEVNGCVLDRKFVQGEAQEAAWNIRSPAPQEQVLGSQPAAWTYEREAQADIGKHLYWVKEVNLKKPKASEKIRNIHPVYTNEPAQTTSPQPQANITEEMIQRGLQHYSEGGCSGLADYERREVVRDILEAALASEVSTNGK